MEILQHPKNSNNITQMVKDRAALAVEHDTTLHPKSQHNYYSPSYTSESEKLWYNMARSPEGFRGSPKNNGVLIYPVRNAQRKNEGISKI